ncbi:MAG: efflux RND transporter periplasmic adaptor subunit [Pseudomonadota bacterium]
MKRYWGLLGDAFWLVVTAGILVGGYLGYQTLGALKEPVAAAPIERELPVVDVRALDPHTQPVPIRGEGFIRPDRQVGLAAQISGRIEYLHPAVESRGQILRGEVLARLDDDDALASVERAQADILSTQADQALNESQFTRNQRLFERDIVSQEQMDELSSRKNQLAATLASQKSQLTSAQIQLERTEILAPFDATVLDQSATIGDVVSIGSAIATLYTHNELEVSVPISADAAGLVPGLFDGGAQPAIVTGRFAGERISWQAQVDRVDPSLDARTRTINVIVRLLDPGQATFGSGSMNLPSGAPPALINAFVDVVIEGARLPGIYTIPSTSLRDGDAVWLVGPDDTLTIHTARAVHVDGDITYVSIADVPQGARLVTSALDAAVDGMTVQTVDAAARTAALSE